MILNSTLKSLEIVLTGAITTSQLDWVMSYVEATTPTTTTTAWIMAEDDGASNSTSNVTVLAAPASTKQRKVLTFSVQNTDTVSSTVKVNLNNNGTRRLVYKATLLPGYTLTYTDGDGWRVWDTSGALLTAPLTTILYTATRLLTNAEVLAWPSTTYAIGPLPVSGYAIKPLGLTWTKKATGGAWTGISATFATVQLQTASSGVWLSDIIANDNSLTTPLARLTSFLGGANTRVAMIACPYNEPVQAATSGDAGYNAPVVTAQVSDHDGLGMVLGMDNNGSPTALGGGNAANTVRATVYYAIEAL